MDCFLTLGNEMKRLTTMKLWLAPLLLSATFTAVPVYAAGDAQRGADVFSEECGECHSPHEGTNKKGPSLFAVVGRKSGKIADFEYSAAMKQSGMVWNAAQLGTYMNDPKRTVPGGKMKYDGLFDVEARADLIAYLSTLHN